ncbi:MAG: hypothetical protein ACD_11C00018G0006 [uncultured bacterium]|nr:MAG: hypothetical protein ACD_11C00018G0006 [uncultured bacterium]HBR71532.1 hypothetical protein [Candidatus Moranbacteria bacterium]
MKETKRIISDQTFFLNFSLFWGIFGILALLSTLLNFFYGWIFISYFSLGILYSSWAVLKNKIRFELSRSFIIINIIFIALITLFSFFVTPTIFSGRDQGSLSNAAINLSSHHHLAFSNIASEEFFSIYGSGKALNFPGFHYTNNGELTTQFPLGYISWLGAFFSVFGFTGMIIANAIAFYLFLLSFYFIGKELLGTKYSYLLLFFTLTSFSFVWFFKSTLSENLTMPLLWIMILTVFYLIKKPDLKIFSLYFAVSTLLIFTRIESYAFVPASLLILSLSKHFRKFIKINYKNILIALLAFFVIFVINFQKDLPFFREIAKAVINQFSEPEVRTQDFSHTVFSPAIRVSQIYILYGLAGFLILGFIGAIKSFWEKSIFILIPLLVTFPALIYLIDSNISSDHPWMLRRFVFAILPLFIFYTTYLFKMLLSKKEGEPRRPAFSKYFSTIAIITLLFLNLKSFSRYAFYSENQNLIEQTKKISAKFSDKDLILVDRLASGDGWSMISGPLESIFKKQAVYFFNPSDIKKIDLQKFENIYLLSPKENLAYYAGSELGNRLEIKEKYIFQTTRLSEFKKNDILPIIRYPAKENVAIEGYILKLKKQ